MYRLRSYLTLNGRKRRRQLARAKAYTQPQYPAPSRSAFRAWGG